MSAKSWEVSDAFWEIVEPIIPQPKRDKEKLYKPRLEVEGSPLKRVQCSQLLYMYYEQAFSRKHCQKKFSAARVQFIDTSESENKKASFWSFGREVCLNMMT